LLLGACTDDPAPKEPTGTASATASRPAPTATLPAMPDQAKENSPEGAAAFLAYWVETLNYASATGDVGELSRISSPDCSGCARYIALYRDTYLEGGYFVDADWAVDEVRLQGTRSETFGTFVAATEPTTYVPKAGAKESVGSGEDSKVSVAMRYVEGRWRVTQLGLGDVE